MTTLRVLCLACWLSLASACSTFGIGRMSTAEQRAWRENAEGHLESARGNLDAGAHAAALDELSRLWSVPGLTPEQKSLAYQLLERALDALLGPDDAAARSPDLARNVDADDLEDLWERDLPRRLRVRAGIALAQVLLAQGERMDSFRQVRAVDTEYATHEARGRAGAVVAEAGLSLAADPGRYLWIFRYRRRAPEVLEYLVLQYPAEPRCDLAYRTLAEIYEEQDELDSALERHRDLVLYHPDSAFAEQSELDIPRLRLARSESFGFDRADMLEARSELERFALRHADARPELAAQCASLLTAARERLCDSDLAIARFYLTIGQAEGARLHARRARDEAPDGERHSTAEALLSTAEALLARAAADAPDAPGAADAGT